MSVKKLIFSAAASLLFLWFVVPLLGMDAAISVVGTATVLVVAVFSVSAAGLIAEGCISLINASNNKLRDLKPAITQEQLASELESDVPSALSDLRQRVRTLEGNTTTPVLTVATSSTPIRQQASQKQNNNKSRVDVLLGAKEAVA
ncbi:MAG: hypothetical protein JRN20_20075 [Nitrososphaerota archaeon]|nr:hypothetical protein [Nitrososphaerota archaeon]